MWRHSPCTCVSMRNVLKMALLVKSCPAEVVDPQMNVLVYIPVKTWDCSRDVGVGDLEASFHAMYNVLRYKSRVSAARTRFYCELLTTVCPMRCTRCSLKVQTSSSIVDLDLVINSEFWIYLPCICSVYLVYSSTNQSQYTGYVVMVFLVRI